MLEKDMYEDIRDYLTKKDYKVKAEVLNTDITAMKDDEVLIIEMKKTLNTRLIYQGCQRQRICDYVYLAIIKPTTKIQKSSQFKEKLHIIKRLQLGLIFVDTEQSEVSIISDPKTYNFKNSKIKKRKLLKEFNERVTSYNTGGVTKTKIITAYREQALLIAHFLSIEPMKVKDIKSITNNYKCASILQKNFYGWFERIERGIYSLTEKGKSDIQMYSLVLEEIIQENELKENKV